MSETEKAEKFYKAYLDDFTYWYAHFLACEKKAFEDGWRQGYDAGRKDYWTATEAEWAAVLNLSPWWISDEPTYMELEEMRYGPLPDGWADPENEENPGEARRRARAANWK